MAHALSPQGVLTLAFSGFPPALDSERGLKAALAALHGDALPAENPGSRWPKSSLGCLVDGRRLTPAELEALRAICTAHQLALQTAPALDVRELRLVLFACRSLERQLACQRLPLAPPLDATPPAAAAAAAASATLAEFEPDKLRTYWADVARDGSREQHYRDPARGATLVAPLPPAAYAAQLTAFRAAVDAALPGAYAWFSDDSLHVTVRALL